MDQRTIKVSFKRVKPAPLRRLRLAANERDTVNAYAAAVGWLGVLMTTAAKTEVRQKGQSVMKYPRIVI